MVALPAAAAVEISVLRSAGRQPETGVAQALARLAVEVSAACEALAALRVGASASALLPVVTPLVRCSAAWGSTLEGVREGLTWALEAHGTWDVPLAPLHTAAAGLAQAMEAWEGGSPAWLEASVARLGTAQRLPGHERLLSDAWALHTVQVKATA